MHDAKRIKPFPRREFRGFANLDSARRNDGFARTKLKPFETFRGSANLDSVRRNGGFALTQFNPLPLCLLETWSPCSRPFAILPVSAVSDAQKLATGNFLHVRAAFFCCCATNLCASRYFRRPCRLFVLPTATGRRPWRLSRRQSRRRKLSVGTESFLNASE